MKVLFYCQNLLGIGHLTRSLAICQELVKEFEVHFVQGGPKVGKGIDHKNFHHHFLDPLLMEEHDSSLYDPDRKRDVQEIFDSRKSQLSLLSEQAFDHCIIELYPFGRRKFRKEVAFLLAKLKEKNPNLLAHCSLRDILVESQGTEKRAEEVAQIVNENFDHVLVHSDPNLFRLEETFPRVAPIQEKIVYTGFVCEESEPAKAEERKKQILVSLGGGSVGIELIEAAARVAIFFPDHEFLFVPGPFSPAEKVKELQKVKAPNIKWLPFLQNFELELSRTQVSISLAGYNTVMNLLHTRSYGLVLPYRANQEQEMRSQKLMQMGFMHVLSESDLMPEKLSALIQHALSKEYPKIKVNLDGASYTRKFLANLKNKK